jgi:pyruvate-formate lyase
MDKLIMSPRIEKLKEKMLSQKRYASIEQALIITETYKDNEDKPVIIKRALALKFIDIKNYAGRFKDAGDMSNHKRALLHHGKMSLEKFMKWLNVLDLEYEIVIRDKHGAPNPMNEELRDC